MYFWLTAIFTTNCHERYFEVRGLQDWVVFGRRCISEL